MARVLVVDDEPDLCDSIVEVLRARSFEASSVNRGELALALVAGRAVDVIVLDIVLPGLSGQETFERIRRIDPDLPCIFITAHGSIGSAVEAMRAGGYDYLTKPFDNEHLVLTIRRALERRGLAARVGELEQDLTARAEFSSIVGRGPAIRLLLRHLSKVATNDVTVLLTGESGTGKELAARSIHRASQRASGPFVAINCATIPPSLAETELFGHERGAFTDAKAARMGRFEEAGGGTLFLDEIGDLSLDIQVKLLRAIQERELYRVGGDRPIAINARIIAATNRDLSREVAAGRFRDDLYWRLNVFQVELPPLRAHMEDLPLLVDHLLDRANTACRTSILGVSPGVLARFKAYSWPGNVRQLANTLMHAVIMTEGSVIQPQDLPSRFSTSSSERQSTSMTEASLEDAVDATERQLVEAALARFQGNRTAAAAALGIDRKTLYNKMRRFRSRDDD